MTVSRLNINKLIARANNLPGTLIVLRSGPTVILV